jgi:hypothetical protein
VTPSLSRGRGFGSSWGTPSSSRAKSTPPPSPLVLSGHAASLTPYEADTPRPSPRTNRTRRAPHEGTLSCATRTCRAVPRGPFGGHAAKHEAARDATRSQRLGALCTAGMTMNPPCPCRPQVACNLQERCRACAPRAAFVCRGRTRRHEGGAAMAGPKPRRRLPRGSRGGGAGTSHLQAQFFKTLEI